MLIELFLKTVLLIINVITSVFPTVTVPSDIASAFASASASLWTLNSFIPIPTLVSCVSILFLTELVILQFKFWKWIVSYIPFFGGRG